MQVFRLALINRFHIAVVFEVGIAINAIEVINEMMRDAADQRGGKHENAGNQQF